MRDLSREDFRLFDDGRPGESTCFEAPRAVAPATPSSGNVTSPAEETTGESVEPPAHVVVFVDNLHIGVVNPRAEAIDRYADSTGRCGSRRWTEGRDTDRGRRPAGRNGLDYAPGPAGTTNRAPCSRAGAPRETEVSDHPTRKEHPTEAGPAGDEPDDGFPFFAMELVEGEALLDRQPPAIAVGGDRLPDGCPETMRHRCASLDRPAQVTHSTGREAIRRSISVIRHRVWNRPPS